VLERRGEEDLRALVDRALADTERGLGREVREGTLDCPPEVRALIAHAAGGDARRALATLEAAASVPAADAGGVRRIDQAAVEEALQKRALLYDKGGDEHYGVVSAFITSLRRTDPAAAGPASRLRPGLPVPARLRGPLRRRGIPARGLEGASLLPADELGARGRDQGAPGAAAQARAEVSAPLTRKGWRNGGLDKS